MHEKHGNFGERQTEILSDKFFITSLKLAVEQHKKSSSSRKDDGFVIVIVLGGAPGTKFWRRTSFGRKSRSIKSTFGRISASNTNSYIHKNSIREKNFSHRQHEGTASAYDMLL